MSTTTSRLSIIRIYSIPLGAQKKRLKRSFFDSWIPPYNDLKDPLTAKLDRSHPSTTPGLCCILKVCPPRYWRQNYTSHRSSPVLSHVPD